MGALAASVLGACMHDFSAFEPTGDLSTADAAPNPDGASSDTSTAEVPLDVAVRDVAIGDALDTTLDDTFLADSSVIDSGAGDTSVSDTRVIDTAVDTTPRDTGVDVVDTAVPCTETGAKTYLGHCYFPTAGTLSWDAAKAACVAASAHLVSITSAGEQAVVAGVKSGDRWIGLSRPVGSPTGASSFTWVTAEAVTYTNWDTAAGEPNGSGECARLNAASLWADRACNNKLFAVCERE